MLEFSSKRGYYTRCTDVLQVIGLTTFDSDNEIIFDRNLKNCTRLLYQIRELIPTSLVFLYYFILSDSITLFQIIYHSSLSYSFSILDKFEYKISITVNE